MTNCLVTDVNNMPLSSTNPHHWHCRIERGLRKGTVPVCMSVLAWAHSNKPAAAGLLLCAQWAEDIDRLLNGRSSAQVAGK